MDKNLHYAKVLGEMIKFNTQSSTDGKTPEMDAFHQKMQELFPNILKVAKLEKMYGCVVLKWAGKDPSHRVLFMNHHDVVPAVGNWTHKPFGAEISDGKLWGRGTLDTKGGLFGMIQAADELAKEGFTPAIDIWFESSCCEETTSENMGSDLVSQQWAKEGIKFDWVLDEGGMIVSNPVGGVNGKFAMVGVGEKGLADIRFEALSTGGHASTPPRNTPLVRLGKFMSYVDSKDPFDVKLTDVSCAMFKSFSKKAKGALKIVMSNPRLFAPVLKAVMKNSGTTNAMLRTTIAFTCAQGSEANNVIPQSAWVNGNMRYSHHEGQKASIQKVVDIAKKYNISSNVVDPGYESKLSPINSSAFNLIKSAVDAAYDDVVTSPYVQTSASDSRFMDRVCDNVYRFVPFVVSDKQVASIHGYDENVDVQTLGPAVDFYKYLMTNV